MCEESTDRNHFLPAEGSVESFMKVVAKAGRMGGPARRDGGGGEGRGSGAGSPALDALHQRLQPASTPLLPAGTADRHGLHLLASYHLASGWVWSVASTSRRFAWVEREKGHICSPSSLSARPQVGSVHISSQKASAPVKTLESDSVLEATSLPLRPEVGNGLPPSLD